jgi:hypothetical protein
MTLAVSTVVVIALLIATPVICLFMIRVLLNRSAGILGDCVQNVKTIRYQAEACGVGYLDPVASWADRENRCDGTWVHPAATGVRRR